MRISYLIVCCLLASCNLSAQQGVPVLTYQVLNVYPHQTSYFTQGLVVEQGQVYEGTGLRGHSRLIRYDLVSSHVEKHTRLAKDLFGEGIAVTTDKVYQLTYKSGRGFVYDKNSFAQVAEFSYAGEGWGLTFDGTDLIMSDGSEYLRYLDVNKFIERKRCRVTAAGQPVRRLNELEFINEQIYANVRQTDLIAIIQADSCKVSAWLDLSGLLKAKEKIGVDVLNGIAYDASNKRLYVTGKLWPKIFEITAITQTVP